RRLWTTRVSTASYGRKGKASCGIWTSRSKRGRKTVNPETPDFLPPWTLPTPGPTTFSFSTLSKPTLTGWFLRKSLSGLPAVIRPGETRDGTLSTFATSGRMVRWRPARSLTVTKITSAFWNSILKDSRYYLPVLKRTKIKEQQQTLEIIFYGFPLGRFFYFLIIF